MKRDENTRDESAENHKNEKSSKGAEGEKENKDVKEVRGKAAESFEELHVYQRARELANSVYTTTRQGSFAHDYGLVDQIRRAAVSVMSNIAEGFERGSTTEFIQFLYIAKGSCGEVRAQLAIASDQGYIKTPDYDRLHDLARRVSGMLSNFIAHLQSTDYKGEKFSRPKRLAATDTRLADLFARHGVRPPNYDGETEDSKE